MTSAARRLFLMGDRGAEARRRNEAMIVELEDTGTLRLPAVAAAMLAVPRHLFLPGRRLSHVYEDTAIPTKVGPGGSAVSSCSQPAIVAIMLQQLRPEPGRRVLEVGAGTGWNAGLLAQLVRPGGRVVTIDFDEDLCAQARDNLRSAGVAGVEVVCADGALGHPALAPYDGLIVTAGAADLAPAWLDQLAEGGRLVVPLGLVGPSQLCCCLVRRGRSLVSRSLSWCGFLPLRGLLELQPNAPDPELQALLAEPGRPAGSVMAAADLRGGFEHWLALYQDGYVRLRGHPEDPFEFALRDGHGLARLELDGDRVRATLHGAGEPALRRLIASHSEWARDRPGVESFQLTAWPAGEAPAPGPQERALRRPHFTFLVGPRRAPEG